jgi:hypothetical protein
LRRELFLVICGFFILDTLISNFLQDGLNKYYGLKTNAEIAFVGHSHLMLAIDKSRIEKKLKKKVAKYTREGVNIVDRDLMIDQLLMLNQQTKIVVYGVDAWMFTGEGLSSNSYKLFYPFMGSETVDDYVKSHTSFSDFWQKYIIKSSRYNEGLISGSLRGKLNNWDNFKLGTVDTVRLKENVSKGDYRRINSSRENIKIFESTIDRLVKRNIKVFLVYVPTISFYNQAEKKKFRECLNYFSEFAKTSDNIQYLEFINGWEMKHDYFFDPIHLNPLGQQSFTDSLLCYLK